MKNVFAPRPDITVLRGYVSAVSPFADGRVEVTVQLSQNPGDRRCLVFERDVWQRVIVERGGCSDGVTGRDVIVDRGCLAFADAPENRWRAL